MASSDRFVTVGEEEILYISNIFAKPQVFYYLVSDAKIFDIIYQLSPFPWDFLASGGPYYETLRLAVDPTNG
jgi:hypothetical protein